MNVTDIPRGRGRTALPLPGLHNRTWLLLMLVISG
jgi:hypothetical protein